MSLKINYVAASLLESMTAGEIVTKPFGPTSKSGSFTGEQLCWRKCRCQPTARTGPYLFDSIVVQEGSSGVLPVPVVPGTPNTGIIHSTLYRVV